MFAIKFAHMSAMEIYVWYSKNYFVKDRESFINIFIVGVKQADLKEKQQFYNFSPWFSVSQKRTRHQNKKISLFFNARIS